MTDRLRACEPVLNPATPRPQLFTGSQCASLDARAQSRWGFSADQLMARAGEFAFAALQQHWPRAQRLCICAGVGNNAGDGYVVARLAQQQGYQVSVLQLHGRRLKGAAGRAQQHAEQAGVAVVALEEEQLVAQPLPAELAATDLVVDALLGIGLTSAPRPAFAALIAAINTAPAPVVALDVPSGLNADTGAPFAEVVQANLTTTFIVDKICLRTGPGRVLAGTVAVSHLGLPLRALAAEAGIAHVAIESVALPAIDTGAYKHGRGHVVVVGGDHGMSGAVLLTAQAALRCGAGLVSVITRGAAMPGLLARCPELMVVDAARWPQVLALLAKATVVVCGPGLGQAGWGRNLLAAVRALQPEVLRVYDADALNLLAPMAQGAGVGAGAVLTPHSGEAARLLGTSSTQVEQDRLAAARALARCCAGVAVLKGPGSIVANDVQASICAHGNPGMASAGMGDVLAGLVAGLLAQHSGSRASPVSATQRLNIVTSAVALHSAAADTAATKVGIRALIATDLLPCLGSTMARCQ